MKHFDPSLYLVTDRMLAHGRSIEFITEQAVKGGVTMVQLREKDCTTLEFVSLAFRLKKLLTTLNIPLIINDRLDIAMAVDADGLHIGQHDMPYAIARNILGYDKIIGLSVENIEQAKEADKLDVDYIGISPVFQTGTKTDTGVPLGLEGLKEIAAFSKHIIVGIGGIHAGNAAEVIKSGAHGVAVVSAIVAADDPLCAAHEIRKVVDTCRKSDKMVQ
jgi:thiamine-phosphate pyrophosphorylase